MIKKIFTRFNLIFLLLIVAENYTLFYYSINLGQQWLNALCYLLSSLLIGFLILIHFRKKKVTLKTGSIQLKSGIPILIFFGLCILFFVIKDKAIFKKTPINPKISDIIPTIQTLVERLLHGTWVYQPIDKFGYHLPVTYLPLQWSVFTPAGYWHFDYRWIALIIWSIGCFWLLMRTLRLPNSYAKLIIPLLLAGIYFLIQKRADDILSNTVETMVAGYYIILIATMNQKNAILVGVGITLCLLSRFSLVVWLPLWAFVMFVANKSYRKKMFITAGTVFVLVLLIYVIPFLSKDWNSFFAGYNYYTKAALGEWHSINYTIMKPYQLNTGTGIAFLFAQKFHNNLDLGLKLLQRTGIAVYILTVLLLGIWYWRNRKNIHPRIFLLASFKIYLSVFLFFIQVPYTYLMIVANFVSIAIFAELLRYKILPEEALEDEVSSDS